MIKDHYSHRTWPFEDSLIDIRGQSTRGDRAIVDSKPLRVLDGIFLGLFVFVSPHASAQALTNNNHPSLTGSLLVSR